MSISNFNVLLTAPFHSLTTASLVALLQLLAGEQVSTLAGRPNQFLLLALVRPNFSNSRFGNELL
jgi:hypothetical protein